MLLIKFRKTVFAKGAWFAMEQLGHLDCQVIGLDWNSTPNWARQQLGSTKTLQGNMDPCQLFAERKSISAATIKMIEHFGGKHIVNLGHGVYPDTPLENVRCFVDTVKKYQY